MGEVMVNRITHLPHDFTEDESALIAQGTRDPFGTREDVAGYDLSHAIELLWLEDGDHDLHPRKSVSGFTLQDHLATLGRHVAGWAGRIAPHPR